MINLAMLIKIVDFWEFHWEAIIIEVFEFAKLE